MSRPCHLCCYLFALLLAPNATPAAPPSSKPNEEVVAWRKKLDAADPGLGKKPWFASALDDSDWKEMALPGFFETKGLPAYDGTVWYRKTVELSDATAGKDLVLSLGAIDDMDMTWFNGQQVGGIEVPGYWTKPRDYKVPGKLVKAGRNTVTVRVIDHGWSGGFGGKSQQMRLTGGGSNIALAGKWRYRPGVTLKSLGLGELTNPQQVVQKQTRQPAVVAEVPELLRPLSLPKSLPSPFTNRFTIERGQTIVVLGSTNAFQTGRNGYLETVLTTAHPQQQVRLRNLAWQADTVYRQQRPRNFFAANKPSYGERDLRSRITADVVFLWMGQAESLDGPERIDEFVEAYLLRLEQIGGYTKRIVLVTPVPFSNPLGLEVDITVRNKSLAVYAEAIKKISRERKLPVVDLFSAFKSTDTPRPYSQNGLHLSSAGHWFAATSFAKQLGFGERVASLSLVKGDVVLQPSSAEALRQAIGQKNELWFRYWRPTNWAFLYGNRQTQPSSRDHTNHSHRWFPEELQAALIKVENAELDIHKLTTNASKQK